MSKMLRPFVDLSSFCRAMSINEALFLRFQIDFESSEGVTEAGSQVIISKKNLNDRLQLPQTIISLSFTIVIIRFFIIIIVNIINYHHLSMYYTICFHVEFKVGIEALKSLFSLNPRSGELATAGVLDRFTIMISPLFLLDKKI